jgi:ribokinase
MEPGPKHNPKIGNRKIEKEELPVQTHPTFDVGCVADLCVDLILSGEVTPRFQQVEQLIEGYAVEPGGSGTIFASQFAKLGGQVELLGAVGADAFGTFLADWLETVGIGTQRIRRDPSEQTGLGVHLVKPDGDRAMLTYTGTIDGVAPADLTPALLPACRHWHLASYFLLNRLRHHWPGWLAQCRAAGITTSLDTNWDPEERWEEVRELLPLIDLFLPNEAEAQAIAGIADVDAAGEKLSGLVPLVVIKRGREGATAYRAGQRWRRAGAAETDPPISVADTVGAGDNFDAGFLRAWLLGWDMDSCLDLATRCAQSSLKAAGGIQGQLRENVS